MLSNHDVVRHATRYGGGPIGVQRARAAAVLVLGLPGSACLYQGDELGLEHVDVPPEARQDPIYRLGGGTGRDGCRVPIPWTRGGAPGFGFTAGVPWLPTPPGWGEQSVEAEDRDSRSTLALYRRLLAVRRSQAALHGDTMAWMEAPDGCLAFRRVADGAGVVDVVVNLGDDPVEVAASGAPAAGQRRLGRSRPRSGAPAGRHRRLVRTLIRPAVGAPPAGHPTVVPGR